MTVYFHKNRKQWHYDFVIGGKRHASYCADPATGELAKTKKEAKDIETRIRASLLAGQINARPNPKTYSLAQAFKVHLSIYKEGGQKENQKRYVAELLSFFGASTPIKNISNTRLLEYVAWARSQPMRRWTGGRIRQEGPFPLGKSAKDYWKVIEDNKSDSTINRYLSAIGKALRLAHNSYDEDTGIPLLPIMPKIPKLKEPDILPRPIAPEDLERLLALAPPHLADAIRLTVLMGFRRAEVFNLTTDHFDSHQRGVWLSYDETKGYRDEFVPASDMAYAILERLAKRAKELGHKHLILYRYTGKRKGVITEEDLKDAKWRPLNNAQSAWESTLKKAGLYGRHVFHNTKATFVTAVAQNMPAAVVKDLARHKDFETTMRYIRVADKTRKQGVQSVADTLFAPSVLTGENEAADVESKKVPDRSPRQSKPKPQGTKLTL